MPGSRVHGYLRANGDAGGQQVESLEGYVVSCYPNWHRWTMRMKVALAMLDRYPDAATAMTAEFGPDARESVPDKVWALFCRDVELFYEQGRVRRKFRKTKDPKDNRWNVLSEMQVMRVIHHSRVMSALRAYMLGDATADEERVLKQYGWFTPKRKRAPRRSTSSSSSTGKKPAAAPASSNSVNYSQAWPDTRGVSE